MCRCRRRLTVTRPVTLLARYALRRLRASDMKATSNVRLRGVVGRRWQVAILAAVLGVATAMVAGAHGTKPHRTTPSGADREPSSEDAAAFKAAEAVFSQHCYRCHTSAGKKAKRKTLEHLNMDQYPFGGHHADEAGSAIRKTLGASGKKATMPKDKPGIVSGDALAKVLAWADAFDRARAAATSKSPAGGHDLDHQTK